MSGHLRLRFAVCFFTAGLSTSPASSNPFAMIFNGAPAGRTFAEDRCLARPGKSVANGPHWVYRLDGHRKCWFQVPLDTALVRRLAQHRSPKQAASDAQENARSGLQRSAPRYAAEPNSPAPVQFARATTIFSTGIMPLVSGASVPSDPNDQLMLDYVGPPPVPVALLAAAESDEIPQPAPSPTMMTSSSIEPGNFEKGITWIGMLLMVLGLISVSSASPTVRAALLRRQLR
jgi:hypothetical protein